jgi:acetoin:2,6-dichlorophenolindophenol oxidoreductase subunit beta
MAERQLSFREAIREALREEMLRDERVFLIGIDMHHNIINHVVDGLSREFGTKRCISTPIVEAGFTGAALGAALTGMRPVVEVGNGCFLMRAYDEVFNEVAKYRYICGGGEFKVPLVIRVANFAGIDAGGSSQHGQSTESRFIGSPGIKVVIPSLPQDAKGLLKSAIRDETPVLFFEHKLLYNSKGTVTEDTEFLLPIGSAALRRSGKDVTIVGWGLMVHRAMEAADELAKGGIEAEVIDLRTLIPYDRKTLLASVLKTGRVVFVEEGPKTGGVGAELAAFLAEEALTNLKAPIRRVAAPDTVLPASPYGAKLVIPQVADIVEAARSVLGK